MPNNKKLCRNRVRHHEIRTLENVTPLFFHLILVRWKNNRVTFSNVFCNGELQFARSFFMFFLPEIAKKRQEVAAVSAGLSF